MPLEHVCSFRRAMVLQSKGEQEKKFSFFGEAVIYRMDAVLFCKASTAPGY